MIDFTIDWDYLLINRVPVILRKSLLLNYLSLVVSGVAYVHGMFLAAVQSGRTRAGLSSSRLSLEAYLRYTYDAGINVVDIGIVPKVVIYREAHARDTPVIYREEHAESIPLIYREGNTIEIGYSFIVELPTASASSDPQIRADVNSIKPVNTTYNIELI